MPKTRPSIEFAPEDRLEIQAASVPPSLFFGAGSVEIEAKAGDSKLSTFDILGYTGAPMNVEGFFYPVIIDLTGAKSPGQTIPALRDHDTSRIVGQTTSIKIGDAGARFAGDITGENADATEVKTQAKNGFKWQASVGASIDRREFLDAGKEATVNGRKITGPMLIARESTFREISFVALGADANTSATVAASHTPQSLLQGLSSMSFDVWLKAKGLDAASLSAEVLAALKSAWTIEAAGNGGTNPGTPPPAPNPAPTPTPSPAPTRTETPSMVLDSILTAQRAENDRVSAITRLIEAAVAQTPMRVDELERISKAAIEAKSTPAEVELQILRLRAEAPAIHVRRGVSERTGAVIEATICRQGGLPDVEKRFSPNVLEAADRQFRHGLGLRELLQITAAENGATHLARNDVAGLLRAAFMSPAIGIRGEGLSTISLPGILSNVANKFLLRGFQSIEQTWRMIARRRPVNDFKSVTSYSLTGDMKYEKVGPGGELKHGTLGELSYSNRAATYGRILSISRQDIINDDLGALTDTPERLGRGAALKLNEVFWTVFLAGVGNYWTSGNNNLISGGTSVLASAGLESATTKFELQTDPDGYPIGFQPKILLVPTQLKVTGQTLLNSAFINTGGSSTTDRVPNANVWQGLFTLASSAYLSNSAFTGYSTTAWWLLADPADLAAIEVCFLNGVETPVVESSEADFENLGIRMRGYHDFGVALQEYRASVRSAGA